MGIEKIDKKYFLNEFSKEVFNLSSKEYQKRVWIDGLGPECDDFSESINRFFDSCEIVLNYFEEFGLKKEQYFLLSSFSKEFERFIQTNKNPPQEFIDTPEWTKITERAKEVLKAFHWKTPDQD